MRSRQSWYRSWWITTECFWQSLQREGVDDLVVVIVVIIAPPPPPLTIPAPVIVVVVRRAPAVVIPGVTPVVVPVSTGPPAEDAAQQATRPTRAVGVSATAAASQQILKLTEHWRLHS